MEPGTSRRLLAAVLATGTILTAAAVRRERPAPAVVATAAGAAITADPAIPLTPRLRALGRSVPTSLRIPALGVDTAVMRLGRRADRGVEVPPAAGAPPGWYGHSAVPGEPGAAVIVGHAGLGRHGPSVFHRLGALRSGDRVTVGRADGGTVEFVVTAVVRHPMRAFPTPRGYTPAAEAELRLVTSGAVVYAVLEDGRSPGPPQ